MWFGFLRLGELLSSHKERNLMEWVPVLRRKLSRDSPFLINYACLRLWLRVGFTKYLTRTFYGFVHRIERLEKGGKADVAGLRIGK